MCDVLNLFKQNVIFIEMGISNWKYTLIVVLVSKFDRLFSGLTTSIMKSPLRND